MYIYIMRHGDALTNFKFDELRPLSDYGVFQAMQAGKWLKQFTVDHHTDVSVGLVSPFLRALQTFEQVNESIKVKSTTELTELIPSGKPIALHVYLDQLAQSDPDLKGVLLVSHMPLVSFLLDELCGQHLSEIFSTASILCIDYSVEHASGQVITRFIAD
ncbi:phosphohistidine phosphatase SixA [Aliiglaciecola sp. LCG003]|uniref:phosphohistidine phosphatase SixA n=1 Tax=Aliiglaciecola sp. LCG003 TaxID=3053655 RepID=UPI002573FED7|nr:phosphohistidine phosphatase SixA [Aliiglaciecola sp. LCG003]WJG10636.1 phosphohistidine phosphatase SixA [Aliiglaciecola sp. LCG003]